MELMTQLQTEQHTSRDLQAKLASQEDDLKKFHETVSYCDYLIGVCAAKSMLNSYS